MRLTTARLEAFSDAVMAIAITLLVIEIGVPPEDAANGQIAALGSQWTSYLGYAVSFAVIGVMWVNHHATFDRVARPDRTLLFLNLGLLAVIAFIPFPTAVLADYLRYGGDDARVAAMLYGATLTMAAVAFTLLWVHLRRHPELLAPDAEPHAAAAGVRRSLFGVAAYAATIPVALLSPWVAVVAFAALPVGYVFAERAR